MYRPNILTRLQMVGSFLIPATLAAGIGFYETGWLRWLLGISAITFFVFGLKRTAKVSVSLERGRLTIRNLFRTYLVDGGEIEAVEVKKPWLPFWQYWDIGSVDAIVLRRKGARRVVCEASMGLKKQDFDSLRRAISGGRHG